MITNLAQQTSSGAWAEAVIKDLKSVRGAVALVWCVIFGTVLYLCFPLEWIHDLQPNVDFFANSPLVGAAIATMYGTLVAQTLVILLPILLNAVMSRYAGIFKIAAGIVIVIEAVDAYIDWPAASAAFNAWWQVPTFTEQPLNFLLWLVCRLVWQVLCTDGFELICVASLVGFLVCLVGIFRKSAAGMQGRP